MNSPSDRRVRHRKLDLNWPTRITLSRILLIVPFIACMLHINDPALAEDARTLLRHVAIGIYLFMAFSDGLDGLLARYYHQVTRLGALLDPVADKLLTAVTCVLLVSDKGHVSCFVPPTAVSLVIVGKDLLLIAGSVIAYLMTSHVYIAPSRAGKLAMFAQLLMGAAVLLAPELSCRVPAYDG
jgi:CDP-diacylglycerol--glycerol-3-phosphate 3-phosphatidyltransferase